MAACGPEQLREGDSYAAQRLWQRYWTRLIGVAHARWPTPRRGPADEEDVAQEAFDAFFRAARAADLQGPYLPDCADDLDSRLSSVRVHQNPTNSRPELDNTRLECCPECEQKIWWACGFDPHKRYAPLIDFARRHKLETERTRWEQCSP